MSRLRGTTLKGVSYAAGRGDQASMLDLSMSGQYAYQPNFGAYVNNAGYPPRNLIALLVDPPRGIKYLPDRAKFVAVLKSLIETQSKTITGLRTGLTVESTDRALGTAGHMQSDLSKVTESISQPTHVWDERYGRPIHNFWQYYIRMLMAEPLTQQPGVMNLAGDVPTDLLPDFYSFTTLYIEPDPLRRGVIEAWMVTNMMPTMTGDLESQLDMESAAGTPEVSIEFKGIPVNSPDIRRYAQEKLNELNYVNAGPMQRPAFLDSIQADISAAEKGYMEDVQAAARSGV